MRTNLFLFLLFLIPAFFITPQNQIYIIPVLWIAILILDRHAVKSILKWKFLLFLSVLILVFPLIIGEKDARFLNIPYSSQIFKSSTVMANRSLIILLSIKFLTNHISIEQISQWLEGIKLKQFSQVFSISLHIMPEIKQITHLTLQECRNEMKSINVFRSIFYGMVRLVIRLLSLADTYYAKNYKD
jgi:hypothetical protein